MPKLVLFDVSGYLYRAYHALPPLTTRNGQQVNAVFGLNRMLAKAIKQEKMEYAAVCFDSPKPTFRHEIYQDYKANRKAPDEALIMQIPMAEEMVRAWGMRAIKMDGYEADDIIASVAEHAADKGFDVVIMTGDKDILQIVNEKITVQDEMRQARYQENDVFLKFGVRPQQLVDYLSLMGDAVDNIHGVPGIGPKTAAQLLVDGKDLESLFKDFCGVKDSLKAKLLAHQEDVFRNRQLVGLRKDVPWGNDLEQLKFHGPQVKELKDLYERLGFKRELIPSLGPLPAGQEDEIKKVNVVMLDTPEQLTNFENCAGRASVLSYYAIGLSGGSAQPFIQGMAFCMSTQENWYLNMKRSLTAEIPVQNGGVPEKILLNQKTFAVGCDLKRQITPFVESKSFNPSCHGDVMLAAYCLEPERASFEIDDLVRDFLETRMPAVEGVERSGTAPLIDVVPLSEMAQAAACRAEAILQLWFMFEKRLKEENLYDLFRNLEMPLIRILSEMESAGMKIDVAYLERLRGKYALQIQHIESDIYEVVGQRFNLGSPKQLAHVLFEVLKLPPVKKIKTGYSTNEEVLKKLAKKHPVCEKILSHREFSKLKSTYVDALLDLVDQKTARVHTTFDQTGTVTGRLSSKAPNLQNIPVRSPLGKEIRRAFIVPEGCVLLSADYSQIDLRVLAHMSGDPMLIEAFASHGDIHQVTASDIFHVPLKDVTPEMRQSAKAINFGIVYGQQAWGLSQGLGIPVEEAEDFIKRYFDRYSLVKAWIEKTIDETRKIGYVKTLSGRRRTIPDIQSPNSALRSFAERTAVNTPIQGSSADIIKYAMIKIADVLRSGGYQTKMLVQVHDELLFEVPNDELNAIIPIVIDGMENAMALRVPLQVDLKIGQSWDQLQPVDARGIKP